MNENQNVKTKKEDVFYDDLEALLDDLPKEALKGFEKIVRALYHEYKLVGETTFGMPHERFRQYKIGQEERMHILAKLHKLGAVYIADEEQTTTPSSKIIDGTPTGKEITILDDRHIVYSPGIWISVHPQRLTDLYHLFEPPNEPGNQRGLKIQHKQELTEQDRAVLEWMLADLPPSVLFQMWQVTSVLFMEYKRQGANTFYLPALEHFQLGDKIVISILKNFQRRKMILIDTTMYKSGKSFEVNLLESDEVYGHENAKVHVLGSPQFEELYRKLAQLQADQVREQASRSRSQESDEIRRALSDKIVELTGEIGTNDKITKPDPDPGSFKVQPKCIEKKEKGYVQLAPRGELILIGGVSTRPYRYLAFLLRAGTDKHMTIESIFEAVQLKRDKENARLNDTDPNVRKTEMISILENSCIKELQKLLGGKLKFCRSRKEHWIEIATDK